jgi:phage tail sheath protein FI
MPVSPTYPGVYIEEIPSGVRTITGVGTSVTAFVGFTQRGPTNLGTQLFSFADYERQFGGLLRESDVSYAVQQFFLNGGAEAWVVRVANGAASAAISMKRGVGGPDIVVLTATAQTQGAWGNNVRLDVDYDTANPASLFNLGVTELIDQGGTLVPGRVETHRNLSMNSFAASFAPSVVNAASELIRLERPGGATAPIVNTAATSTSGTLTIDDDLNRLDDDHRRVAITINGDGPYEVDLFDAGGAPTGTLNARLTALASQLQAQVRVIKPAFNTFGAARVGSTIQATAPTPNGEGERSSIRFSNASIRNATSILKLGTANGGREVDGAAGIRPVQTGTVGGSLAALDLGTLPEPASINVTIQSAGLPDVGPDALQLWTTHPTSLEGVRQSLQTALGNSPRASLNGATVSLVDGGLRIVAGGTDPNVRLHVTEVGGGTVAGLLRLTADAVENVARYALGIGVTSQAQAAAVPGDDGTAPTTAQIRGIRAAKTGIFALEDVDLFNILCLPNVTDVAVLSDAIAYADERRSFVLLDFPPAIDTVAEARQWLNANGAIRDKNAAIYFPRVQLADPLEDNRVRSFPTCGVVAGIYARTDVARGVWKAPAGTEAQMRGVQRLDYTLTDPENGALNPLGINCLRNFPVYGPVVWGARTLFGADALASEWKYVPVRRMALYLEESLYRGTKWVVFEPNDEPLWAQIRLNVGAFMHNLFRQGAFQGQTPREAYFVKCDKETTTQNDIDLGIVNIVVGFRPLKPAEFVILKIQQIAGQVQA